MWLSTLKTVCAFCSYSSAPATTLRINAPSSSVPPSHTRTPSRPVDAEVSRLFGPYARGRRRLTVRRRLAVAAPVNSYTHLFCCLQDKNENSVPSRLAKRRLFAAGLGEKRLTFKGDQANPREFREFLFAAFPKLRQGGGFELLRTCGQTRSRQLSLIPCPNEGYHVTYLKDSQACVGYAIIFIRPLQRNLNLEPICQPECSTELVGPPQRCLTCGEEFPFLEIKAHSEECMRLSQSCIESSMEGATESASPPRSEGSCGTTWTGPQESQAARASNMDISVPHQGNMPALVRPQGHEPAPQIFVEPIEERSDWQKEPDPTEAAKRFKEDILDMHATKKPLNLVVDFEGSAKDRERAILSFYKMAHVEWASPFTCTLKGDPAVGDGVIRHFFATAMSKLQNGFDTCFVPGGTLLFEGEEDHLLPSTSHFLLESDFFIVAGRMMGHSFLHDGPCLGGLSPAILHVFFGGSPEEATIDIKDCADLDIREKIQLLEGTAELSHEQRHAINDLALSWDFPPVTIENRRWLLDKLLLHAVLGRTSKQVKHMRRGLKETLIWPLLTERKDTVPLLFPRASEIKCTAEMVLAKIKWPTQDEDSDVSLEDTCRITGFLRTFIENASPNQLGQLVQFWVGWNVLPRQLEVEVLEGSFPKCSTCFYLLKLPAKYEEYGVFERDLLAAIGSVDTGFGLV